jgi:hypothetical protein
MRFPRYCRGEALRPLGGGCFDGLHGQAITVSSQVSRAARAADRLDLGVLLLSGHRNASLRGGEGFSRSL